MLRKIWLFLAQALVLIAAGMYVLQIFVKETEPPRPADVVTVKEAPEALGAGQAQVSFRGAAAKAIGSVVNVYSAKTVRRPELSPQERLLRRFYGLPDEPERGTSLGSGVIVSQDGYVLTNNHVIEGADEVAVVLGNGPATRARVVGADPETDLAILKIEGKSLRAITLGDSDRLQVGDVVLAIGNPFGVGQTVTMGIVSATGRNRLGINAFENFIQTDAPINPGNSGGALIDARGDLVGINTAIYSQTGSYAGIGFAVPVKTAKTVMEQLIKTGRVERGWLGAEVTDVTPEIAERLGTAPESAAVVVRTVRGAPAEGGGLQPGDIIVSLNGKPTPDAVAVINAVADTRPGQTVQLGVKRKGAQLTLKITIGKRPPAAQAKR
jgi:serine protease DegQ